MPASKAALPETLARSRPALWVEVAPPRGSYPELVLKSLTPLAGHADAINLTDNSLGRIKMSGLAFGSILKSRLHFPVVLNVSCRDRNRFALQSDLLGAGALGIDAIVALTGDPIPDSDSRGAKAVYDLKGISLLKLIADIGVGNLRDGKEPLKRPPQLCAGTVANPNRKELERELQLLERKASAGAKFVITQPVFDADTARRFVAGANKVGIATVLGILPVKRESMASYMKKNIADLSGAHMHLDRYAGMSEQQVRAASIRDNLALMQSLAREVDGFNIMSGGGPSLAIELALEFSKWRANKQPTT